MMDVNCAIEGFEESTYLQSNRDVYEAVKKGDFFSGWQHFVLFGFDENRPGVSFEVQKAVVKDILGLSSSETFPPNELRKRVHGDENLMSFERVGSIVASNIHDLMKTIIELKNDNRILDFGCGCGRVIRHLYKLSKSKYYGTDIDSEAIAWCQSHLSTDGEFVVNKDLPPLPFEDEFFDLVYSVSVFTHLPEDMQFAWLDELRRITKRGGYLILTTHGEELMQTGTIESTKQLQEKGFYYSVGTGTEGLPDFYQTSFHSEDYIRSQWSKFFEIRKIIKKGIANHQDLVLCVRRNND